MVCCFPEGGSTYSDSVDVPVSADILWSVVRDLDALPQVVGAVVEYTPEDKTKELAVGFRFEEQRMAKQKTYTLKKTVTRFETDNQEERCLSFGITPTTNTDVVNTSTLIVQPVKEGNTSTLFLVIAFELGRDLCTQCYGGCCNPCLEDLVVKSMRQELEDYRAAAIRAEEKVRQNKDVIKSSKEVLGVAIPFGSLLHPKAKDESPVAAEKIPR